MKATNEARCVFYQRDWSVEELEAGECDSDNEALCKDLNLTLLEIAEEIRGWHISPSKISHRTWAYTYDEDFRSGGQEESSLRLSHDATKQEKSIWIKALEFAKMKG